MIKLSDRLQIIADRIKPAETMADIGTDHGFLPIYLKETGICSRVIMADISEPSLGKARMNAAFCSEEIRNGLEFRAGDGLQILSRGEVEAVVIAGMGGRLIRDIMAEDMDITRSVRRFVLQPRIGQGYLRKWLYLNGFSIISEDLVYEGDYIPEIITVSTSPLFITRSPSPFLHSILSLIPSLSAKFDAFFNDGPLISVAITFFARPRDISPAAVYPWSQPISI